MIKPIKCMHCGTKTMPALNNIRSYHKGLNIILREAPVHYCSNCNESLISLEALTVLRYIKTLPLKSEETEFYFSSVFEKAVSEGA